MGRGLDWGTMQVRGAQSGLTVDSTAAGIALTPTADKSIYAATIACFTAPIRYWTNGTAPTTSTGRRLGPNEEVDIYGDEIPNFLAIREGATSGVLEITYYG